MDDGDLMPIVALGALAFPLNALYRSRSGVPEDVSDVALELRDEDGVRVQGPWVAPAIARLGVGEYRYLWDVPSDLAKGTYLAVWTGTIGAGLDTGSEQIEVVRSGSILIYPETPLAVVDPVAVLREVLIDLILGSSIEAVPVRTQRKAGELPPFILLTEGGSIRHPSVPLYAPARVNFEAWALDEDEAAAIYLAAAQLMHRLGLVIRKGVAIFQCFEETGLQQPFPDPDTGWWRAFGVFDLTMVDQILA